MKSKINVLIILCLGILVYANSLDVPFAFDDEFGIVTNPVVKDFSYFRDAAKVENVKVYYEGYKSFSAFFKGRWVGYFTFALNYRLNGLHVQGYHAVNIAVHIINALLVYWLVLLTFRTPFMRERSEPESGRAPALFVALFFVCHPLQTQAVTYIVQRFTSLAALFYLLSLALYIRGRLEGEGIRRYGLYAVALVSSVLAMKTKELAFTLPLVVALYEFLFFDGDKKKRLVYLLPMLITLFIIPVTVLGGLSSLTGGHAGASLEALRETGRISRWAYLLTQFTVITTYIRLMFPPIVQNVDYDYPLAHSFFEPGVFLSFLLLLSLFSLGIYLIRGSARATAYGGEKRLMGFGIIWFFITLSVESSVLPIADVINEHRVYLPLAGFMLAAVACGSMVRGRLLKEGMMSGRVVVPIAVVLIIILSGATFARNTVWQDKVRLWSDVVNKSPNKARGHNNLGQALGKQGRYSEAIGEFQTAIQLKPDYSNAYSNLGVMYRRRGYTDEALASYQKALQLDRFNIDAYNNIGVLFRETGRLDEAEQELRTALALKPDSADLHSNLGLVYDKKGRFDEALREFRTAEKLAPHDSTMRFKRETAAARVVQVKQELEKGPDKAKGHYNLGVIYDSMGDLEKAEAEYRAAIGENQADADAHSNLGVVFAKRGLFDKAREELAVAQKLKPGDEDIRRNLALVEGQLKGNPARPR